MASSCGERCGERSKRVKGANGPLDYELRRLLRRRLCLAHVLHLSQMSALSSAASHRLSGVISSLDNLVRPKEQRLRDRQAERLRRPGIHDQLELCRLFDRQVCGLGAAEDLVDVPGGLAKHISRVDPVAEDAPPLDEVLVGGSGWEPTRCRPVQDECSVREEHGLLDHEQSACAIPRRSINGVLDVVRPDSPAAEGLQSEVELWSDTLHVSEEACRRRIARIPENGHSPQALGESP